MTQKILIIGYGNNLRSDDSAGQKLAEIINQWNLENVSSLAVHQLTPELSEAISQVDQVIFADALLTPSEQPATLQIIKLKAVSNTTNLGHYSDPSQLLSLTQAIYGRIPLAYWILIPAINFEFGEQLSPVTGKAIQLAITKIREMTLL
ncbi:MAG TPA: hydrogenase maturation protease [Cyanothece sp. UBA12306]|nr:hydrogenase maturation protease [Cyanothece sp. UBA12306]